MISPASMARISKPPIPYKMYRHFAVITVMITASIAMFADGENREVIETQIEEQQAEQDRRAKRRVTLHRRVESEDTGPGEFGEDYETFGAPMVSMKSSARNSNARSNVSSIGSDGRTVPPGYSQSYIESLSEQEYRKLVDGLNAAGMLDPATRRNRIAALERASRTRSGRATEPY